MFGSTAEAHATPPDVVVAAEESDTGPTAASAALGPYVTPVLAGTRAIGVLGLLVRLAVVGWTLWLGVLSWRADRSDPQAFTDVVDSATFYGALLGLAWLVVGAGWSVQRTRNVHRLLGRFPTLNRAVRAWCYPAAWMVLMTFTLLKVAPHPDLDWRPPIIAVGFALCALAPYRVIERVFHSLTRVPPDAPVLVLYLLDVGAASLLWWQLVTWPRDGAVGSSAFELMTGSAFAAFVALLVGLVLAWYVDREADRAEAGRTVAMRTRHDHRRARLRGLDPMDPATRWALWLARQVADAQGHDVEILAPVGVAVPTSVELAAAAIAEEVASDAHGAVLGHRAEGERSTILRPTAPAGANFHLRAEPDALDHAQAELERRTHASMPVARSSPADVVPAEAAPASAPDVAPAAATEPGPAARQTGSVLPARPAPVEAQPARRVVPEPEPVAEVLPDEDAVPSQVRRPPVRSLLQDARGPEQRTLPPETAGQEQRTPHPLVPSVPAERVPVRSLLFGEPAPAEVARWRPVRRGEAPPSEAALSLAARLAGELDGDLHSADFAWTLRELSEHYDARRADDPATDDVTDAVARADRPPALLIVDLLRYIAMLAYVAAAVGCGLTIERLVDRPRAAAGEAAVRAAQDQLDQARSIALHGVAVGLVVTLAWLLAVARYLVRFGVVAQWWRSATVLAMAVAGLAVAAATDRGTVGPALLVALAVGSLGAIVELGSVVKLRISFGDRRIELNGWIGAIAATFALVLIGPLGRVSTDEIVTSTIAFFAAVVLLACLVTVVLAGLGGGELGDWLRLSVWAPDARAEPVTGSARHPGAIPDPWYVWPGSTGAHAPAADREITAGAQSPVAEAAVGEAVPAEGVPAEGVPAEGAVADVMVDVGVDVGADGVPTASVTSEERPAEGVVADAGAAGSAGPVPAVGEERAGRPAPGADSTGEPAGESTPATPATDSAVKRSKRSSSTSTSTRAATATSGRSTSGKSKRGKSTSGKSTASAPERASQAGRRAKDAGAVPTGDDKPAGED